jgi:hypothetical protein
MLLIDIAGGVLIALVVLGLLLVVGLRLGNSIQHRIDMWRWRRYHSR